MRKISWVLAGWFGLAATPILAADGGSLARDPDQVPWARWQGRLSLGTGALASLPFDADRAAARVGSASLLGDYYFGRSFASLSSAGGFRATSGLIFGPRTSLSVGQPGLSAGGAFSIGSRLFGQSAIPYSGDSTSDSAILPYVGVGYTNLSVRSGWSFSADLGLVAQSPGGLRLIRNQSLDDAVREMRLAPLLQLGVSYAF
jgi:hypothetical protein